MENLCKKKRVKFTFEKGPANKKIKAILKDLYKQVVIKDEKVSQKIELALASLGKYPLPLESGKDCFILKGFDQNLCRFIDLKLIRKKSIINLDKECDSVNVPLKEISPIKVIESSTSPVHPVSGTYSKERRNQLIKKNADVQTYPAGCSKDLNSVNEINGEIRIPFDRAEKVTTVRLIEEIDTPEFVEVVDVGTDPICLDSDDEDKKIIVNTATPNQRCLYRTKPNSEQDAAIIALYLQQLNYPTRPALNKRELILKADQHLNYTIQNWNFMRVLLKKTNIVKMQINKDGIEEFLLTPMGMKAGKVIFDERDNILKKITSENYNKHKHDECCHKQGCHSFRVAPPQVYKSLLVDRNLFIDMAPTEYEVIMVVDKNEPETLAAPTKNHKVESRNLKIGDILWVARNKRDDELVLPFIVERKRLDDFAASIKDGRFHEQKFRLRKCGLRHVIYVIEDYPGSKNTAGLPRSALEQAKVNTRIHDGFMVHETDSLKGTKRFLDMLTARIIKELEGKHLRGTNLEDVDKELMSFDIFNANSSKTKPLTVKETFVKMLVQLKGLSVEKALAITNVYNGPKALMDAYDKCEGREQELMLANLRYNNYTPKVGPSISKTLCMLFNKMSFDNASNEN